MARAFARDGDIAMFMFDGDRGIRGETPAADRAMMKVYCTTSKTFRGESAFLPLAA